MSSITGYIVPCIICLIIVHGLINKVNVFDNFLKGAADGLKICVDILPALIGLLVAVGMLKASGVLDVVAYALSPLTKMIMMPAEIVPLALIRPISGSGALAVYEHILQEFGPDGIIGKIASVMQGSTETTFYTIAVYYGVTKVKKTRHTVVSGLTADIVGFIMSAVSVQLLFGAM